VSVTQTSQPPASARAALTAATVLFGEADAAATLGTASAWPALVDRLAQGLASVPAGPRESAAAELGGAVANLLGLRLGDALVAAWRAHQALVTAARATIDKPLATELVQLATHRISTSHRPYIDITVNGATLATLHFELNLVFDIDSLLATVRRGRLVALGSGRCMVTGSLACEGMDLASRHAVLDPAVMVEIGDGIPLLGT
jgi:hypothetical protein